MERFANYLCHQANPLVQVVYFFCAGGGFYVYVFYGFPHLPGKYVGEIHKVTGTIIMLLCYTAYFLACYVNPGTITTDTVHKALRRYKCDGIIFANKQKCRTCNVEKPARSKHCSMCNVCIEKFDHHCIWINQCVGLHNYKWFLCFIGLHCVITVYGFVVGMAIFYGIVEEKQLLGAKFINNLT